MTGVLDVLASLAVGTATVAAPRPPLRFESAEDAGLVELELEREAPWRELAAPAAAAPVAAARAAEVAPLPAPAPAERVRAPQVRTLDDPPAPGPAAPRAPAPETPHGAAPAPLRPEPAPEQHVETVRRTVERLVEVHEVLVPASAPAHAAGREVPAAAVAAAEPGQPQPSTEVALVAAAEPVARVEPGPRASAREPVVEAEPRPRPPVVPPAREPAPVPVQVTIGRVEVVAPTATAPPQRPVPPPTPRPAAPDLAAYLASLDEGRRA